LAITWSSIAIRRSSGQLSGLFGPGAGAVSVPGAELEGALCEAGSGDCAFTLLAHNPAAASQIEKGQIEKGRIRDARIVRLISGESYPHH